MFSAILFAAALPVRASMAADVMRTPACTAGQLSLSFDTENGNFDGMSHSGALLVLRNFGAQACTVLPKPQLAFQDADHHPIAMSFEVPRFMHPGPVQVPVVVPAGAEVTGNMRWVSSEVYSKSVCVTPAYASLHTADGDLQAPFGLRVCGQAGQPFTYQQEPVHRDPGLAAAQARP